MGNQRLIVDPHSRVLVRMEPAMTTPIARDPIYRRRRFEAEISESCVRWYITYRLSYRDFVAMIAERGLAVSHTTILRWVIRYVPEFEKRWSRRARKVHSSWRVDETYISVRGKWHYLYRAVDKRGKTVDFLLRPDRGIAAARAFFRKALATSLPRIGFTNDSSRSARVVSGGTSHSSSFGTGLSFQLDF
jgi:transposase-like protein